MKFTELTAMPQPASIPRLHLAKPVFGMPCNGCGLCCRTVVCQLGLELGDRKNCKALVLKQDGSFSCGLVLDPYRFLPEDRLSAWKTIDGFQAGAGEQALKDYHAQVLGAGRGCDSDDDYIASALAGAA